MIEGKTILCFASGYDAPPTSKHHVMHLLAERNTVLWINYHASRKPSASASDMGYVAQKLREVFRGVQNPRKNLYVLTPLVLPLPGAGFAKRINRMLLKRQIRKVLRKISGGALQIWSFAPDVGYLIDAFAPEKVVYYCVDDFANFTGYDAQQVLRDERELAEKSDLVVTTSQQLQDSKAGLNPNTICVPHGVDYDHFAMACTETVQIPDDLKEIANPRVGFFGLIRDWVDLDLLAEVARKRSDWNIVLLGDSDIDLAPYREIPNMHFLGNRPYAELPNYCAGFDVGVIPFVLNELTAAVNPIKLREYLAAGLEVVSTPLPEVQKYSPPVRIAATADEFVKMIAAALAADPQIAKQYADNMKNEKWESKLEKISHSLNPKH